MAIPPAIPPMDLSDPMYKDLPPIQQEELYFQLQMLHAFMAMVQYQTTTEKRARWILEFAEFCYQNHLSMLRMPRLRDAIIYRFEDFFLKLAAGNPAAAIPLDLRDQMNRMYGMLLESNRNLRKDPLWLD